MYSFTLGRRSLGHASRLAAVLRKAEADACFAYTLDLSPSILLAGWPPLRSVVVTEALTAAAEAPLVLVAAAVVVLEAATVVQLQLPWRCYKAYHTLTSTR